MTDPNNPYGSGAYPTGGNDYGQSGSGAYPAGGPQYGATGGNPGTPPENNLVWAILCTVLCCLPLGVVSIIKATGVNNKWAMGDYAGAQKDAEDAKKFAMWGAIAGVVFGVLYVIFIVATGAFSASLGTY